MIMEITFSGEGKEEWYFENTFAITSVLLICKLEFGGIGYF